MSEDWDGDSLPTPQPRVGGVQRPVLEVVLACKTWEVPPGYLDDQAPKAEADATKQRMIPKSSDDFATRVEMDWDSEEEEEEVKEDKDGERAVADDDTTGDVKAEEQRAKMKMRKDEAIVVMGGLVSASRGDDATCAETCCGCMSAGVPECAYTLLSCGLCGKRVSEACANVGTGLLGDAVYRCCKCMCLPVAKRTLPVRAVMHIETMLMRPCAFVSVTGMDLEMELLGANCAYEDCPLARSRDGSESVDGVWLDTTLDTKDPRKPLVEWKAREACDMPFCRQHCWPYHISSSKALYYIGHSGTSENPGLTFTETPSQTAPRAWVHYAVLVKDRYELFLLTTYLSAFMFSPYRGFAGKHVQRAARIMPKRHEYLYASVYHPRAARAVVRYESSCSPCNYLSWIECAQSWLSTWCGLCLSSCRFETTDQDWLSYMRRDAWDAHIYAELCRRRRRILGRVAVDESEEAEEEDGRIVEAFRAAFLLQGKDSQLDGSKLASSRAVLNLDLAQSFRDDLGRRALACALLRSLTREASRKPLLKSEASKVGTDLYGVFEDIERGAMGNPTELAETREDALERLGMQGDWVHVLYNQMRTIWEVCATAKDVMVQTKNDHETRNNMLVSEFLMRHVYLPRGACFTCERVTLCALAFAGMVDSKHAARPDVQTVNEVVKIVRESGRLVTTPIQYESYTPPMGTFASHVKEYDPAIRARPAVGLQMP